MMNSLLATPLVGRVLKAKEHQLLHRILNEPALVAEVRALPPQALAKLIHHVGLEDAGEIVELATAEQIARVFDEDLWKTSTPGEDEAFDADRFIMWLEILIEAGERAAARRLAELCGANAEMITFAFHRLVVVVDVDELAEDLSEGRYGEDGRRMESALEASLYHEIGSFMIIARRHDGWDAIITALVALDEEDHALCTHLLDRCVAMSAREADDEGGLYDLLLSAEQSLEADVEGDRDDRRAREGFVSPADARSFLKLTKQSSIADITNEPRDAVTRAYFREVDRKGRRPINHQKAPRLLRLLEAAGVLNSEVAKSMKKKLPSRVFSSKSRSSRLAEENNNLSEALHALAQDRPSLHIERMEELAYLVNVLIAGESFQDRTYRPAEAAERVVAIANAGLTARMQATGRDAKEIVASDGIVLIFRLGLRGSD